MHLLTRLDLDTGFDQNSFADDHIYFEKAKAGLEHDVLDFNGPNIIKNPYFCDLVDEVLASGIRIGHVIIPFRNFEDAARSRKHIQEASTGKVDGAPTAGGLWGTEKADDQVNALREKFTNLIAAIVRHDLPHTFLDFPRFANDPNYLFRKLSFMLGGIKRTAFCKVFAEVSRPEWIHDFRKAKLP